MALRRRRPSRSSSASSGRSSCRSSSSRPARSATSRPGLKSVRDAQVGDTVTTVARPAAEPLPGYQPAKSLVFAGIYPVSGEDYPLLREALEKLHLNDASFTYEPESSVALGFGFRCGFLGPAPHGDRPGAARARVRPRPDRVGAVGRVPRRSCSHGRGEVAIDNPSLLPNPSDIEAIEEPWVKLSVVTPSQLHRAADGALDEPPRARSRTWSTSTRPGSSSTSRCRSPS